VVGLWNASGGDLKVEERIEKAFPGKVVTSLSGALEQLKRLVNSASLCETES
jgi:hypothetical protein